MITINKSPSQSAGHCADNRLILFLSKFRERAYGFTGRAFDPVDISWLVFFRISFGLVLLWQVAGFFPSVQARFIEPGFRYSYYGFHWLAPLPEFGFQVLLGFLCLLAVCVVLGLFYRLAMAGFFIGFSYLYLLDQAFYLNHLYLVILLAFLMIFLPANRALSDDVLIWPKLRSSTVPAWTLWLLRAQLAIVYVFAAIAKIDSDWLLRGEPVRTWMSSRTDYPVFGPFLQHEWVVYSIAWGGFLVDLLIVPFLLWPRTRTAAFLVLLGFHLANHYLFNIGIFPWLMIAATTLFFEPDWPRRALALVGLKTKGAERGRKSRKSLRAPEARLVGGGPPAGQLGRGVGEIQSRGQVVVIFLIGLYLAIQIALPLRHHLYPGNASWTEEGHAFAWRMLLRTKQGEGEFSVRAFDPRSETWVAESWSDLELPFRHQRRIWTRPEMALEYAHHIGAIMVERGYENVEVRARIEVRLNARPAQLLIDPEVNLLEQRRTLRPAWWILPLRE